MSLVEVAVEAGVGWLTLNDPARRNILSAAMVGEIVTALDDVESRKDVRALVVTGAGPAFCAGANLGDLVAGADGDTAKVEAVYDGFLRVARSPLPTIAAVNGPAVGAGMNLAIACDVRIAARSAWFDTRFLQIGIHPGGGHAWMLRRIVGAQTAAALMLFGERVSAERAEQVGLVHRCVDDTGLREAVDELLKTTADVEPELLRQVKLTLQDVDAGQTHAEALAVETERQMWSLALPSTRAKIEAMLARL